MPKKNPVVIRGVLTHIASSRLAYKPYGYGLDFSGQYGNMKVLVEVEVPADSIIEMDLQEKTVVISLEGLKALLDVTATSIDKLDELYKERIGY